MSFHLVNRTKESPKNLDGHATMHPMQDTVLVNKHGSLEGNTPFPASHRVSQMSPKERLELTQKAKRCPGCLSISERELLRGIAREEKAR